MVCLTRKKARARGVVINALNFHKMFTNKYNLNKPYKGKNTKGFCSYPDPIDNIDSFTEPFLSLSTLSKTPNLFCTGR